MSSIAEHSRWLLLLGLALTNVFVWQAVFAEERNSVLTIAFLDVGQGDAIFIEAPSGNQLLIDGGRGSAVLRELGRLLPLHDRSIDVVIATHPDADHIGGLPGIINSYDISYVFRSGAVNDTGAYRALGEAVEDETGVHVLLARRGMRINLGAGAYFDILFPDRDVSKADPNDASVVGRLVYGQTEVMLTGDAPKTIEQYLVSLEGGNLESDILKAGHHGSNTSSGELFVGFVSSRYAVISAGCGNSYGHPHEEVLDTLSRFDIETLSTCEEGTIVFETDGATLRLR